MPPGLVKLRKQNLTYCIFFFQFSKDEEIVVILLHKHQQGGTLLVRLQYVYLFLNSLSWIKDNHDKVAARSEKTNTAFGGLHAKVCERSGINLTSSLNVLTLWSCLPLHVYGRPGLYIKDFHVRCLMLYINLMLSLKGNDVWAPFTLLKQCNPLC